ncbi:hypothetical protein FACUT_11765 [Fusarium acutatum]|uniref:Uncharacterized protein n=1 Tax=Fusarium acutatum TaxID=78861 RepID=A0A8H4JCS8_9HYPO|nr:hypothetical protein FACUT_11765 [Fusarium acutatum]
MMYLVKILGFALLFTTTAQAVTNFDNAPSGAHYAKGSGEPTCTLVGTTVTCSKTEIQGVGNTNANLALTVTATFTGTCTNPGGHVVEPFTEEETASHTEPLTPSKNGRLIVPSQSASVQTSEEFEAAFTCPNPNWTPDVSQSHVSFTYSLTFVGFDDPVILITG